MEISGKHNLQILRGINSNKSLLSISEITLRVDLYHEDDGTGRQQWFFKKIYNDLDLYNIQIEKGVQFCPTPQYLSVSEDGEIIDVWEKDDGSGRQQWLITPVKNSPTANTFNISISKGVKNVGKKYLGVDKDSNLVLTDHDDGSGRQRWMIQDIWIA